MNDEIKYWLEGLDELSYEKVLDYITNLQEDVRTGKEINAELKQENQRLKQDYINVRNYIKMRNVSTEVEDKALLYNIELENINKKKYLDYKSRCEKAIEYNYELQERYCHSAIFDELVASKVYEITEKELNILQNGSDGNE